MYPSHATGIPFPCNFREDHSRSTSSVETCPYTLVLNDTVKHTALRSANSVQRLKNARNCKICNVLVENGEFSNKITAGLIGHWSVENIWRLTKIVCLLKPRVYPQQFRSRFSLNCEKGAFSSKMSFDFWWSSEDSEMKFATGIWFSFSLSSLDSQLTIQFNSVMTKRRSKTRSHFLSISLYNMQERQT